MGLFDLRISDSAIIDIDNTCIEKTQATAVALSKLHCSKVCVIDKDICSNVVPGTAHFIFTTNRINAITFIEWVIKHYGPIEELTISTYSIGKRTLALFKHYFDTGLIRKAEFVICGHMKRINDPRVLELESMARSRYLNVKIHYKDNHSKIFLFGCGQDKICLMGSGNFAENSYHEQYLLIDDARVFDFYRSALLKD